MGDEYSLLFSLLVNTLPYLNPNPKKKKNAIKKEKKEKNDA
jgi:hypothetical protein